ncbi:MAG TPA: hypothetical protein VF221_03470 [Chloroflexota bacterium]
MTLEVGKPVVVQTPDRREYRGRLVELREARSGKPTAVIRLDTGWVTSYPVHMVFPLDEPTG